MFDWLKTELKFYWSIFPPNRSQQLTRVTHHIKLVFVLKMYSLDRLAELKRQREAEDPQAHAEARAHRRQRTEEMKKTLHAQEAQRVLEHQARRAHEAREHAAAAARSAGEQAAQEARRAEEAHAARRAKEVQEARRLLEAEATRRALEREVQASKRALEAQCAQDLEDACELAEIQEYETLTRALAQGEHRVAPRDSTRPPPVVVPAATLLQSAVEAAREALRFADKVRRDVFLEEREERLRHLADNHQARMRAECERVDRGVTVAPIEYILGFYNPRPHDFGPQPVTYYRVLLGGCNLTFSYLPNTRNKLSGIQWETQFCGSVVPWEFWNPAMAEIDPDFQDDVFILPHFREEIATHLETHSLIHAANRENWFFLGPAKSGLDPFFEVTLTFLARMKRLNRLEFATISSAL